MATFLPFKQDNGLKIFIYPCLLLVVNMPFNNNMVYLTFVSWHSLFLVEIRVFTSCTPSYVSLYPQLHLVVFFYIDKVISKMKVFLLSTVCALGSKYWISQQGLT